MKNRILISITPSKNLYSIHDSRLTDVQVFADRHTEIQQLGAGTIGALVGLKATASGDTLVARPNLKDYNLQGITAPQPVFTCSLECESTSQEVVIVFCNKDLFCVDLNIYRFIWNVLHTAQFQAV